MTRATLVLVALMVVALFLGGVGQAKADFIYGTAQVSGTLLPGGVPSGSVNDGPNFGFPVSASASNTATGVFGSTAAGSGSADVGLVQLSGGFTWQLHSQSHASEESPQNVNFGGDPTVASVTSRALWQDVLFLSNTDPHLIGHTLRLNYIATGSLGGTSSTVTGGGDAETKLIATGSNDPNLPINSFPSTTADASLNLGDGSFAHSGWDTLVGSSSYTGTFHLDIPIVPGGGWIAGQPGSFFYQLADFTAVDAEEQNLFTSQGDAADPAGFLSITLPDVGNVTPESLGVSVTFQSGIVSPDLQPSATAAPEPASLTLLGLGGLCLGGRAWRRRKAAGPAA
jgi:hypothetical protein